jgi:hypothetical protein
MQKKHKHLELIANQIAPKPPKACLPIDRFIEFQVINSPPLGGLVGNNKNGGWGAEIFNLLLSYQTI